MNLVDSSGWLEYFAGGPNAGVFAPPLQSTDTLVVPTLSIYEVFKRVYAQRGEEDALAAVALMEQGHVVELDSSTALTAARLSLQLKLPMADSIMLATAAHHEATFWTQDADFAGVPGVRYVPRR